MKPSMVAADALLASSMLLDDAHAVPAFARQTGQNCNACHVSFPELTPYGRYFKLSGYTLGKPLFSGHGLGLNFVPLAAMAQVGYTNTRKNHQTDPDTGESVEVNPRNDRVEICCASSWTSLSGS